MNLANVKVGNRLLVRNGARGTQVAVVSAVARDGQTVRAHKWLQRGARWTKPITLYDADVLGFATPDDFRKRKVVAMAGVGS